MDTGIDPTPPENALQADSNKTLKRDRPLGITILAIRGFSQISTGLLFIVAALGGERLTAAFFHALDPYKPALPVSPLTFGVRLFMGLAGLLAVVLTYAWSLGLWRLRNWARRLLIGVCALDVIVAGTAYVFWPFGALLGGPVFTLLGSILSLLLVCYLFSPRVKIAFGVRDPRPRWFYATAALALAGLISTLYKSQAEFRAMQWHLRHGNQICVNGVSFPVYRWYTPEEICPGTGFRVDDRPGPLRSKDGLAFISVQRDHDEREGDRNLSAEELVSKEIQGYEKAGYKNLRAFQLQVRAEPLKCMEENDFGHVIYCYGDGPIGQVFFAGGNQSFGRFQRMLADAK